MTIWKDIRTDPIPGSILMNIHDRYLYLTQSIDQMERRSKDGVCIAQDGEKHKDKPLS